MRKIFQMIIFLLIIFTAAAISQPKETKNILKKSASPPIESCYPVPSRKQLKWQNAELVLFVHFGINTFTNREWGDGLENPALFNPKKLDAMQWVRNAKECGFKFIILTAKHHDGFCLWPSKYTEHSVKSSPYKSGKGDIVKEFSEACRKLGVSFGVYLSPWDRHEETYGTDQYNIFFQNQLTELLTGYGNVGEVWFDGANGEGPNGKKQVYNWNLYYSTVRHFQPDALIAVTGPDIRWIGNEDGLGSKTEWCGRPRKYDSQLSSPGDSVWYPSECDVSIRPGWFYHRDQDSLLKSVDQLVNIYFKSVGRNSNLLLNVPPDKDGLFSVFDVKRLKEWKKKLDEIFANDLFEGQKASSSNFRDNSVAYSPVNCLDNNRNTFWATDKNITSAEITIKLKVKKLINIIRLEEAIEYGQRIKSFEVFGDVDGTMKKIYGGTSIGRSRIITFDKISTDKIKIKIADAFAPPVIRIIKGFYNDSIKPGL